MNRQIVILAVVVCLGVVSGLWVVSRQEQKSAGHAGKEQMIKSMTDLRLSIDQLNSEIKALRLSIPAKPSNAANAAPTEDYDKVYKIDVAHTTVFGKKDAPVTIVEFMDFQCPYCGRFHPGVEEVLKQYPDQVNYMIKNYPLPFHQQAKPAAKAALAAGEQGKYYEMANLIIKNQSGLNDDAYKNFAQQLGLDVEKFLKDLKDKDTQWEDIIKKDMELGEKVGVRGTPTYYVNGKKTRSRTAEQYKEEIDAILKNNK